MANGFFQHIYKVFCYHCALKYLKAPVTYGQHFVLKYMPVDCHYYFMTTVLLVTFQAQEVEEENSKADSFSICIILCGEIIGKYKIIITQFNDSFYLHYLQQNRFPLH